MILSTWLRKIILKCHQLQRVRSYLATAFMRAWSTSGWLNWHRFVLCNFATLSLMKIKKSLPCIIHTSTECKIPCDITMCFITFASSPNCYWTLHTCVGLTLPPFIMKASLFCCCVICSQVIMIFCWNFPWFDDTFLFNQNLVLFLILWFFSSILRSRIYDYQWRIRHIHMLVL